MSQPEPSAFPINKLVPFLRAMADPTGSGEMSAEDRDMIDRVEANLTRRDAERQS